MKESETNGRETNGKKQKGNRKADTDSLRIKKNKKRYKECKIHRKTKTDIETHRSEEVADTWAYIDKGQYNATKWKYPQYDTLDTYSPTKGPLT